MVSIRDYTEIRSAHCSLNFSNGQSGLKADDPFHAGPYAMLVRDVAFCSHENSNHDYLWLPEIMEDICNGYKQAHGELLHDELNRALVPMIVKFWSAKYCGDDCIEVALDFLYRTAHDRAASWIPNTCFEGGNKPILPEQIISAKVANEYSSYTPSANLAPPQAVGITIMNNANGGLVIRFDVEGE